MNGPVEDFERHFAESERDPKTDDPVRSKVWWGIYAVLFAAIIFIALKLGWIA